MMELTSQIWWTPSRCAKRCSTRPLLQQARPPTSTSSRDASRHTLAPRALLVEQNDILQTCPLVTLGMGAAVDVPVIRRCPACGELTSREGDLGMCRERSDHLLAAGSFMYEVMNVLAFSVASGIARCISAEIDSFVRPVRAGSLKFEETRTHSAYCARLQAASKAAAKRLAIASAVGLWDIACGASSERA
ncbi:hypothetical protein J8273_5066 [Carpediemonas membranifera]|uniref:Uncharacterized protein n=1 Tax=Carpediemonas membranifera TaxID=201153 RepID=A0A8J6DZG3_9EUKA|nr:hypothetical protein J8273_5066 [Carpediemonas membranifera]|eukprot:KAG9393579.1 hypothetical protein J8273_5066 [Carpediemonas membranifera]